ncbi:MAG: hypothetical protein ACE5IH_05270 [Thermodesulfobacteriota bacterium]
MSKVSYISTLEKISHNVKVIHFGVTFTPSENPWKTLLSRAIRVGKPIDVEKILHAKGIEDVEKDI